MKVIRVVLLVSALLFIALATLTPGASQFTTATRPDFWCFACGEQGGADVFVNFALFVPLGIALALRGVPSFQVLLAGALLSAAIELAQRIGIPPSRVANVTDILTNTGGAFAGALVAHASRFWMIPGRKHATPLLVGSSVVLACVFALTGWSLAPLPMATAATPMVQSPFPLRPGYGWYHGFVSRVTYDDEVFAHRGDGPIVLRGASRASQRTRVELTGRDERAGFVPFLYVHGAGFPPSEMLLGQEGNDARLSVRLRGSVLRLPAPDAILAGAFANAGTEPHIIEAVVTPQAWTLSSRRAGRSVETQLRLSLGLGWTLIQTVVRNERPTAVFITALWMFVLFLPLGYFSAFGGGATASMQRLIGPASYPALFSALCVLIAILTVVPRWAGIAATGWEEWVAAVAGFGAGVFFASRVWRHQQRFDVLRPGHQRLSPLQ